MEGLDAFLELIGMLVKSAGERSNTFALMIAGAVIGAIGGLLGLFSRIRDEIGKLVPFSEESQRPWYAVAVLLCLGMYLLVGLFLLDLGIQPTNWIAGLAGVAIYLALGGLIHTLIIALIRLYDYRVRGRPTAGIWQAIPHHAQIVLDQGDRELGAQIIQAEIGCSLKDAQRAAWKYYVPAKRRRPDRARSAHGGE